MKHLLQMHASDVCELMPRQLEHKTSNGWEFWSKRKDDELDYQRTIHPMIAGASVVSSSAILKLRIKSIIAEMASVSISVVQFWAPIKVKRWTYLSTADQPFTFYKELDERLFEYRRLCLDNLIPIDMNNEGLLGPPGRVFSSGLPEFSRNVRGYSAGEFPLLENAIRLGICSYCAIPVFNPHDQQCLGVFEIASTQPTLLTPELIQPRDDAGFDQIEEGLHVIRKIHNIPFAQIWIPRSQSCSIYALIANGRRSFDSSSSIYDEFADASDFCYIQRGKGLVGRAFSSEGSCFCRDVTLLSLTEYPLVPSARKARLTQSFVICLQSKCADNVVCIVEYFLPHNEMVVRDAGTFLNMLLSTMKKQLPGVRVASGQELGQRMLVEVVKVSPYDEHDSFEVGQPLPSVRSLQDGGETKEIGSLCRQSNSSHKRDSLYCEGTVHVDPLLPHPIEEAVTNRGTVNVYVAHDDHIEFEKDRGEMMQLDSSFDELNVDIDSTANASDDKLEHNDIAGCFPVVEAEAISEDSNFFSGATTNNEQIHSENNNQIQRIENNYEINRDILQQHFGLTLKEAAKNLSVSPSTLKRICRAYNIGRWPHHKTRRASVMSVKATYRDDIISFKLTRSSTMVELEGKMEKGLNISLQKFSIKYQDGVEDWVKITGDSDLREGMHQIKLLGRNTMKLMVTPKSHT